MKKTILFGLLLAIVSIMAMGCSCESKNKKQEGNKDYDGVVVDFNNGVSHIVALHRQTMFRIAKGENYVWYETKVLFNDSITWDNIDSLHVTDVTDVFQTFNPSLCQMISTNVEKGTIIPAPIPDIWIEDCAMNDLPINLWPADVLEKLKAWDGILPPAAGMTLRCPLGPKACNAQWVIGNIADVIFVDAVTGEISEWCPAFPQ